VADGLSKANMVVAWAVVGATPTTKATAPSIASGLIKGTFAILQEDICC
jgi:hypothetical protein